MRGGGGGRRGMCGRAGWCGWRGRRRDVWGGRGSRDGGRRIGFRRGGGHCCGMLVGEETEFVIQGRRGWVALDWREMWHFRELLFFLVWRDVKVRYKQTVLGVAWAVLQPVFLMVVFTIIFNKLAGLKFDGGHYEI